VSRLEAYKRADLLLEAFARMPGRRLVVIGDGPEMPRLRSLAPPNASLLGRLATDAVRDYMRRARAFVFAGVEDFGIVMAEAQACGTALIALGRGGAAEIAQPDTGVLFAEQTAAALIDAVQRFERHNFTPEACRHNVLRFDRARFRSRFDALLRASYNQMKTNNHDNKHDP
jgi:glycosyltransferase involved in cell wall biosynthesis